MESDLQSLHRALSEAETGSRELDDYIHGLMRTPQPHGASAQGMFGPPPYTTSLDAITDLIERKLPGWGYGVNTYPNSGDKRAWCEREAGVMGQHAYASSLPLALCIALVSALIAQEGEK